jgi:CrcB protein
VGRPADLPIDPDLDPADDGRRAMPFDRAGRPRWPRLRLDVVAAVFVGGCAGGWARYAATSRWPAPAGQLPWATFSVNVAGAFVLALVVVIAADIAPSRYLRPLLGTGFCGALTTFSSVVVTTDQLYAHHPRTAAAYLAATIVAGLAAASFGLAVGRAIAANRSAKGR